MVISGDSEEVRGEARGLRERRVVEVIGGGEGERRRREKGKGRAVEVVVGEQVELGAKKGPVQMRLERLLSEDADLETSIKTWCGAPGCPAVVEADQLFAPQPTREEVRHRPRRHLPSTSRL